MCPQEHLYSGSDPRGADTPFKGGFARLLPLVLIIVFTLAIGSVLAQNMSEEYLFAKNWNAPDEAVLYRELKQEDGIYLFKGKAFSGIAIEQFSPTQLSRAVTLHQGKQNGLMLMWYPDGSPQMSATYRDGILHGRFLGWYHSGGVIYDMVINQGTYAGDNMAQSDDGRDDGDREDLEREGPDNDQSKE